MGVVDFMPVVRPKLNSTNTDLDTIIKNHSDPHQESSLVRIGVDMSILLVQAVKSSSACIDLLFAKPIRPVDGLNDKICDKLQCFYDRGALLFCVFDGLPGQLKKDHAHLSRYGMNEALKNEVNELYKVESFDSVQDERNNIARVKEIRGKLAAINRTDLLSNLTRELERRFPRRVFCIGSAYEADHQLACLSRQKVIDYVYTNDNDLSVLGTDVILNVNAKNGKCFKRDYKELLEECLPSKVNVTPSEVIWSAETLHHAACFLGNDFIKRNPGNSLMKLGSFMKAITESNGKLKDENTVFEYIYNTALTPTNVSNTEKQKWDAAKKISHIKKWKESMAMFTGGPAFVVVPSCPDLSPRDAVISGEFSICLGSYSSDTVPEWEIKEEDMTEYDVKCSRTLLIGFNPDDDLRDALSLREELSFNQRDENQYKSLLKRSFQFEIWTKNGNDILPLEDPKNELGQSLFHGSIIDFDKVPIRYHSKAQLDFWLSCRQIKTPLVFQHVTSLVKVVWDKFGDSLKPIPKELMRGCSGYCSPELLIPTTGCETTVRYFEGDDALAVLRRVFPVINDSMFTAMFGKRNGTRKRIHMHLEGGSFDISQLKITEDLASKEVPDKKLIVISIGCTPSQKLKKDGKEKFYDLRLVIEQDNNGHFINFMFHPFTRCGCPNGCVLCAHLGAFIVLLHLLARFDLHTTISDAPLEVIGNTPLQVIRDKFPTPVNTLLSRPTIATYAFSLNNSEKKLSQNLYKKKNKSKKGKKKHKRRANHNQHINNYHGVEENTEDEVGTTGSTPSTLQNLGRANGIELSDEHDDILEYALEGILDATDEPTVLVISDAEEWLKDIKSGRDSNGIEMKTVDAIEKALAGEASYRDSDMYRAKTIKVKEAFLSVCDEFNWKKIKKKDINLGDESSSSSSIESNCDSQDSYQYINSEDRDLYKMPYPEPICIPVIKATSLLRNVDKEFLSSQFDLDRIRLDMLASNQVATGDDNNA